VKKSKNNEGELKSKEERLKNSKKQEMKKKELIMRSLRRIMNLKLRFRY